jgi:hypothetical protein
MTKKREPRPPLALPAVSFNDAQDADITEHVEHWYELIAAVLGSEAGQLAVQGDIYRQLKAGDTATLPLDYIVAMADARHPPADHALRAFIHDHIDADRFADLPVQLRAYAQRALMRPPLDGYPSNAPQVVNDLTRDIAICVLVDQIVLLWPAVSKLYTSSRRRFRGRPSRLGFHAARNQAWGASGSPHLRRSADARAAVGGVHAQQHPAFRDVSERQVAISGDVVRFGAR